ncbi:MAG: FecR family protein [Bacteroidales bacterium]
MKKLFKKYFQSVITPQEFEHFSCFINDKKNEHEIYQLMDEQWHRQEQEELVEHSNPLLLQRIKHAILSDKFNSSLKKVKLYSIGLRLAAAIFIGLIVGGVWMYYRTETPEERQTMQVINVPNGAKTELTLPDGSSVWLNGGSSLSYSSNFLSNSEVELEGEAFFDVVKSKTPFRVKTSSGAVEVLGTAFNVQAYKKDEFTATLERGKVKIISSEVEMCVYLEPGEQAQLIDGRFVKNEVDTQVFTSWKDGKLIFEREPFPITMKRLERWFNIDIIYSDSDFDDLWFSGVVENETVSEVMDIICKVASVSYSYNSKTRVVEMVAIRQVP